MKTDLEILTALRAQIKERVQVILNPYAGRENNPELQSEIMTVVQAEVLSFYKAQITQAMEEGDDKKLIIVCSLVASNLLEPDGSVTEQDMMQ